MYKPNINIEFLKEKKLDHIKLFNQLSISNYYSDNTILTKEMINKALYLKLDKEIIKKIYEDIFKISKNDFLELFKHMDKKNILMNKILNNKYQNIITSNSYYINILEFPTYSSNPITNIETNYSIIKMGHIYNKNVYVNDLTKWNSNFIILIDKINYEVYDIVENLKDRFIDIRLKLKWEIPMCEKIFLFESTEDEFYYLKKEDDRNLKIDNILNL
jgi:hypothetical protein